MKIKYRVWEILENTKPNDKGGRVDDYFLMILILLNVVAVILGTVKSIEMEYETFLYNFEVFSVVVFSIEYFLRIWSCTVSEKFYHPVWGRVKYALSPLMIIDLLAILPFFLPFFGFDLRFLRTVRLIRIFRIAKAARYVSSLKLFAKVFKSKREELLITSFVMLILLVIASSLMYMFEYKVQPDKFTDIPTTMWWAVATLTTVGYGDVYPITVEGKIIASIVAVLGIGFVALPTGILGSGFVEEFHKSKLENEKKYCPHCGEEVTDE